MTTNFRILFLLCYTKLADINIFKKGLAVKAGIDLPSYARLFFLHYKNIFSLSYLIKSLKLERTPYLAQV